MANVRIIISGYSTGIQAYFSRGEWLKFFNFFGKGIIELQHRLNCSRWGPFVQCGIIHLCYLCVLRGFLLSRALPGADLFPAFWKIQTGGFFVFPGLLPVCGPVLFAHFADAL